MKNNRWLILAGVLLLLAPAALADHVALKDGTRLEGTVQKIEQGQVTILVGSETKVVDILQVANIEFDSARMTSGTERLPLEHFLSNMEVQEMVGHFRSVEGAAAEVRSLLDQTKQEWADQKSVAADQTVRWEATKERFGTPMANYQDALNDLYFHVLGKVDEYNSLMKDADSIYVGVKGWFTVGSSLIPRHVKRLPLKKYVPGNWYDTIFYEGYNQGYNEAFAKYGAQD